MRLVALASLAVVFLTTLSTSKVSASVFLPYNAKTTRVGPTWMASSSRQDSALSWRRRQSIVQRRRRRHTTKTTAMAIPGYGVVEQVFVGGFSNFLSIYNIIITVRILLSWFPQAQGIPALQPVFIITDPFLNLFRGVLPTFGGLDFSPILAFFALNLLTSATAAVGYELPPGFEESVNKKVALPYHFQGINKFIGKHQGKVTIRQTMNL